MEEVKPLPPVNKWKKILDFALFIGKRLVENGAEIHRVEETVAYICKAYGCKVVDVYATPNMIEATVESEDEYFTTKIKRIRSSGTNLYNIERLNNISRTVCKELPPVDSLEGYIKEFDSKRSPKYMFLLYVGAFIGCFGFTLFFCGSWRDGIAAAITAVIMGAFLFTKHKVINKIVDTLIVSLIGGFLAVLLCKIKIGEHLSSVMIGSLMMVIPGMALSTSFKDILMDDLVSGTIRFLQSIATALIIAIGYSAAAVAFRNDIEILPLNTEPWQLILYGIIGTMGFALIFNNNYKHLFSIALGALVISSVYALCKYLGWYELIACMVSSATAIFFAEIFARIHKAPSISFLTPIIICLAPGYSLYCTMFYFWNIKEQSSLFTKYLLNTFYISFGIGGGIIVGMVVVKVIKAIVLKIKSMKKTNS